MGTTSQQRHADAAFFEDWSEWLSLDNRPERPANRYRYSHADDGGPWHEYYLRPNAHRMGFELALHDNGECLRDSKGRMMVGAIPDPLFRGRYNTGYSHSLKCWFVPALSWDDLRAKLPTIKQSCLNRLDYLKRHHEAALTRLAKHSSYSLPV